jgi:hypothetical protein
VLAPVEVPDTTSVSVTVEDVIVTVTFRVTPFDVEELAHVPMKEAKDAVEEADFDEAVLDDVGLWHPRANNKGKALK